jgi:hypothetical protein
MKKETGTIQKVPLSFDRILVKSMSERNINGRFNMIEFWLNNPSEYKKDFERFGEKEDEKERGCEEVPGAESLVEQTQEDTHNENMQGS